MWCFWCHLIWSSSRSPLYAGMGDFILATYQTDCVLQQEDIIMFAKLVLSLATNNPSAVQNVQKSLEIVQRHYSSEMLQVIHFLMKPPGPMKVRFAANFKRYWLNNTIEYPRFLRFLWEQTSSGNGYNADVRTMSFFCAQLFPLWQQSCSAVDKLEGELQSELENGRLVRLLCKFGFINERPECVRPYHKSWDWETWRNRRFDRDPKWSETGDRYIIKLFRDFVFHSVDETGNPVVNMSHVLTHLNKV